MELTIVNQKVIAKRMICPKCGEFNFYDGKQLKICKCMRDAIRRNDD